MELYHPLPVHVERADGGRSEALCFIPGGPVTVAVVPPTYLDDLVAVARRLELPGWYVERIESCPVRG